MPEQSKPEQQLEYLKELRRKYEEVLKDAEKSGDYSEAKKLKEELNERLTALEAQFPKQEKKSYEYLSNPENFSETKALKQLESYLSIGVDPGAVVRTLACFNSEEAIKLRNKCQDISQSAYEYYEGLAGTDNPVSSYIREEILKTLDIHSFLTSISGLDSAEAWKLRQNVFEDSLSDMGSNFDLTEALTLSLIGLDTEQAWAMRKNLMEIYAFDGDISSSLLKSLAGIDTEQAWDMRIQLYTENDDILPLIRSLTGIDSDRAWSYRDTAETMDIDPNMVDVYDVNLARSVAGIDTEQAWDYRVALYKGKDWQPLLESLAGLDSERAWELRRDISREMIKAKVWDLNKDYLPNSINGDFITAIGWRTAKKYAKKD